MAVLFNSYVLRHSCEQAELCVSGAAPKGIIDSVRVNADGLTIFELLDVTHEGFGVCLHIGRV